jgi:outer membrane protein assembly factor BamB
VPYNNLIIIGDKAYKMEDGSVAWNKGNGMLVGDWCPTIVAQDKAVVALSSGKVLFVDAQTGNDLWSFVSKKDKYQTKIEGFLSGQDKIFVNSEHLTALDFAGKIIWQTNESYPGQMAFVTNHLIITGSKGTFCISPKDGKVKWKSEVRGATPAICGTKVIMPENYGVLTWDYRTVAILSLIDGKKIGSFDIPRIEKKPANVVGVKRIFIGRPWSGETLCFGDK